MGNIVAWLLASEALRERALDLVEGVYPKGKPEHWQENASYNKNYYTQKQNVIKANA